MSNRTITKLIGCLLKVMGTHAPFWVDSHDP